GFGFPPRFTVSLSDDAEFKQGVTVMGGRADEDLPNPHLQPQSFDARGRAARYIRVTATKLAPRQNDYIFALAALEALTLNGRHPALGAAVTALDSIEAPARWQRNNLTDGWYPGVGENGVANQDVAQLRQERAGLLAAATTADEHRELSELERGLKR